MTGEIIWLPNGKPPKRPELETETDAVRYAIDVFIYRAQVNHYHGSPEEAVVLAKSARRLVRFANKIEMDLSETRAHELENDTFRAILEGV